MKPFSSLSSGEIMRRSRFISDSLLAFGGTFFLTGLIFQLHLPSRLPDSLLVYLPIILALAYLRGLYPALLTSIVAFVSFDFLFVPPLYSFAITKFEDILTLIVFLLTSIVTAELATAIRIHEERTQQRMRETQLLYDIVCAANREEDREKQLRAFISAIVELFSHWGVYDGMVLLAGDDGSLKHIIGHHLSDQPLELSAGEEHYLAQALKEDLVLDLARNPENAQLSLYQHGHQLVGNENATEQATQYHYMRLIPLKAGNKVIGILRLLMKQSPSRKRILFRRKSGLPPLSTNVYFSTLLEQAIAVIERDRLRNESIRAQALQQTEGLRAALLSSVSHNLRMPLSTIKTAATSLQQNGILWQEEARDSFLEAIVRETDRLDQLVENLLDMSRIEAGVLHPDKGWYVLGELLYDVLDRMQPFLQGRTITVQVPDDLPPVELDYVQIDQVITNLLENAVYYTSEGSPLEIQVLAEEEWMQFRLADHGPGIPASETERIFDKFYRLQKRAGASEHRGTGLGLAICRGLIEAHGGRIWVEPRDGGVIFCFTLPRRKTEGEFFGEAETHYDR